MRIPVITSLYESAARIGRSRSTRKPESISVIISSYNNPAWLEKVLWGYHCQRFDRVPYDLIVADDGSTKETAELIESYRKEFRVPIKHLWQEDKGFRKCRILNKAILASTADFLIFTDQDCIPRSDFLESHFRYAEEGYYLSGGYIKLPRTISVDVTRSDIESSRLFNASWLKERYRFSASKFLPRLVENRALAGCFNWLTTTSATCNGNCFSAWRNDLLAVNGFNEVLGYGGQDRELGERLLNFGIRSKQLRYSMICLHLDHERPYETKDVWKSNHLARKQVRRSRGYIASSGIRQMCTESSEDDSESGPERSIPLEFCDCYAKRVG